MSAPASDRMNLTEGTTAVDKFSPLMIEKAVNPKIRGADETLRRLLEGT